MTTEHLLLPMDLGHMARHLAPYAIKFAELLEARLHVVHVVSRIDHFSTVYMPGMTITKMESMLRWEADNRMAAFSGTWLNGIDGLKTAVLFGDVAQELIRYIENESISFVVMGKHARSGLNRFMHGSVSDQVARKCRVPVMLINISASPGPGNWVEIKACEKYCRRHMADIPRMKC